MNETVIGLIARMFGAAFLPLMIGWGVALYRQRKENALRLPKGPLIVGGLIAAGLAANSGFRQLSENAQHAVTVTRIEKPAPGVTDTDLTTSYLDKLAAAEVAQLGKEFPTTTSTSVIEQDGKRLGIIRFKTEGVTPMIGVFGLVDGSMVGVFCAQEDILGNFANVDVRSAECSKALKLDFGTVPDV